MSRANKARTRCTYTDPEQNDYIGDIIKAAEDIQFLAFKITDFGEI